MFRVLWRFPIYGMTASESTAVATAESWAFPVTVRRVPSTFTFAQDPLDLAEFGHKEPA